jgi:hypothetical protein
MFPADLRQCVKHLMPECNVGFRQGALQAVLGAPQPLAQVPMRSAEPVAVGHICGGRGGRRVNVVFRGQGR